MKFDKIIASIGLISVITTSSVINFPQSANAFHETNKFERRGNLENGWVVFYSKELSHEEMLKIGGAIAADSTVTGGSATATYFADFARQSLTQLIQEARKKSPALANNLQNGLTVEKLLSSIKSSFNGNEVKMSIGGQTIAIGKETYNRRECTKILSKKRCISMPNTHQPYIRVAR